MATLAAPTAEPLTRAAAAGLQGQAAWAARSVRDRLRILGRARHLLAARQRLAVEALAHLPRTAADSLAAELLPLLAACEFLERNAERLLRPARPVGRRPFWLGGVHSIVERVPLGTVLVIGPGNYPLFLPAVQTLQALAAGNAVYWKPGRGGEPPARLMETVLRDAGLPAGVLSATDDSVGAAEALLQSGVDQVVFTGSGEAGRSVQRMAAETSTPVIAELSGCDAVFVLPGADLSLVADALCFGLRLNGSATCMAPRRLMLIGEESSTLLQELETRCAAMAPVALPAATGQQLRELVEDAAAAGARIVGDLRPDAIRPVLVLDALSTMKIAQADVFAPVLSVLRFRNAEEALRADRACPYGLTAAVFGPEEQARQFACALKVGTVLINDLIVPTADPRVPFGGRRGSGFGVTRGAEGLLAMTAPRTVLARRGGGRRHLQPTGDAHRRLFSAVVVAAHAGTWRERLAGWKDVVRAARTMGNDSEPGSRA